MTKFFAKYVNEFNQCNIVLVEAIDEEHARKILKGVSIPISFGNLVKISCTKQIDTNVYLLDV